MSEKDENYSSANNVNARFRLPRYTTHDALRRMGFCEDMIAALHPQSTPIAYPEAGRRNLGDKLFFEFRYIGNQHISSYLESSYIIKSPMMPGNNRSLLQVHRKPTPGSKWHASPQELKDILEDTPVEDVAERLRAVLDLAEKPKFVSRAVIAPSTENYAVPHSAPIIAELSFNRVGTQQIMIDPDRMRYYETTSIANIKKFLEP